MKKALLLITVLVLIVAAALALNWWRSPTIGHIHDEAQLAGLTAAAFTAADEDFFHDMDNTASLTPDEIKGRNTWLVWSAGNDRLWDRMTFASVGALDFLKTLSSYPKLNGHRANRWDYFGLVNEPCFEEAAGPRADRYGLWLDTRDGHCPPDPFENEQKYPGVKIGARGKNIPAGSYYGYASGVVGLRLFPTPISMQPPRNAGILSVITPTPRITTPRISSARIASACHAVSATSAPIPSARLSIAIILSGKT